MAGTDIQTGTESEQEFDSMLDDAMAAGDDEPTGDEEPTGDAEPEGGDAEPEGDAEPAGDAEPEGGDAEPTGDAEPAAFDPESTFKDLENQVSQAIIGLNDQQSRAFDDINKRLDALAQPAKKQEAEVIDSPFTDLDTAGQGKVEGYISKVIQREVAKLQGDLTDVRDKADQAAIQGEISAFRSKIGDAEYNNLQPHLGTIIKAFASGSPAERMQLARYVYLGAQGEKARTDKAQKSAKNQTDKKGRKKAADVSASMQGKGSKEKPAKKTEEPTGSLDELLDNIIPDAVKSAYG